MASQLERATRLLLLALLTGTMFVAASSANEPATQEDSGAVDSPLQTPAQGVRGDEVFSRLLEHNHFRDIQLESYSALRSYEVTNDKGKVHAKALVIVHYQAPSAKTFKIESEEGSKIVRKLVFKGLMDSESETGAGRSHRDSSIRPENYSFQLLGEEDVGGYHAYVVEVTPKRRDKYLFEGRIWIDTEDFGIVQIIGHPAKNPSFWIKRVSFVRRYQKIGQFWLPQKDESNVELKIFGKKIFTIDHHDYVVNGAQHEAGKTTGDAGGLRSSMPATPNSAYRSQEGKSGSSMLERGKHGLNKE